MDSKASMQSSIQPHIQTKQKTNGIIPFFIGLFTALLSLQIYKHLFSLQTIHSPAGHSPSPTCHPPLPNLFKNSPITAAQLPSALDFVDGMVNKTYALGGIDGLVVAIVTRNGAVYERAIGKLKANETSAEARGTVDRNSIFRIASGSKLFAALEALVLRERGALQLDDPVGKYLPGFAHAANGWTGRADESGPITVRQLATHMSGLTREFPRGDMPHWPYSMEGTGAPPGNGQPFPTLDHIISGLERYPLTIPTYSYPIYSNVGVALLGQVAVSANQAFEASNSSPSSWEELAKRDIFAPLGLNDSDFVVTSENKARVAVAAHDSFEVDLDFLAMSSSGGQMSSLADYTALMQTLLDPTLPQSLLPPHVVREWLHPVHGWFDDTTEVGFIWEIEKIRDSYRRPVRIFEKSGMLNSARSVFAINADMSYGVALLMTGTSPAGGELVLNIFRYLQPFLDELLAEQTANIYSGRWTEPASNSEIVVAVMGGSFWVTKLLLRGSDVLRVVHGMPQDDQRAAEPIAMWSTGTLHEFRMAFTSPSLNCMRSWVTIDDGFARGYPTDLLYFTETQDSSLQLHVPSVDVTLQLESR